MPAECYACGEWGCSDEDGNPIPFMEGNERKCACDCHSWLDKVSEAADEIERLRTQIAGQEIVHAVQKTNTLNDVNSLREELMQIYTAAWEAVRAIELSDGEKLKEFREWMMGTLKKEG
jgi:hypothetical protein